MHDNKTCPNYEKARKWDEVLEIFEEMKSNYGKLKPYEIDFFELFLERLVKGHCPDCGETNPCPKHHRETSFYADYDKYLFPAKSKRVQNQKLRELIEKRIEIHKETYDKLKNVLSPDDKGSMFKACQEDMLNELQKLLEDSKKC